MLGQGLVPLGLVASILVSHAPETCPIPRRASVWVDGGGLDVGSDALLERARVRAEAVLRQWDIRPAHAPEDPRIEIAISSLPGTTGYRMSYGARAAGHAIDVASGTAECRLCTEDEFVEQLESVVDSLVPRLVKSIEPAPAPESPVCEPVPIAAPVVPAPLPSWSRLHRAGVGLGITGALTTGFGLGLALGEPLLLQHDADRRLALWPIGVAVASAGAAMLISGVVVFVIERRGPSPSRSRKRAARGLKDRTARAGLRARP